MSQHEQPLHDLIVRGLGGDDGAYRQFLDSLSCPMDSVLYVASWYPLAVLFCAGVGGPVIGRALKW